MSKGMRIFFRIVGILLIVMSLLLTIISPIAGIIGIVFGILLLIYSRKKPTPPPSEHYSFRVAGLYYHTENTEGLKPFEILDCDLIPEPENEHDPNAIKVVVNGKHIGYVPSEMCIEVRNLLTTQKIRYITVGGSAEDDGEAWDDANVTITYERSNQ